MSWTVALCLLGLLEGPLNEKTLLRLIIDDAAVRWGEEWATRQNAFEICPFAR
ncbi:MAG: hypothetical protein GX616_15315 [Planctomycetes bacterium]|nr:hypothetical protein [Planctomycetota bacterium]